MWCPWAAEPSERARRSERTRSHRGWRTGAAPAIVGVAALCSSPWCADYDAIGCLVHVWSATPRAGERHCYRLMGRLHHCHPFRIRAFCSWNSASVRMPAFISSPSCASWASRSPMSADCAGATGACGGGASGAGATGACGVGAGGAGATGAAAPWSCAAHLACCLRCTRPCTELATATVAAVFNRPTVISSSLSGRLGRIEGGDHVAG